MWHNFKTRHFFSTREKGKILAAIGEAERLTSGEIRVHVESHAGKDALERAAEIFTKLGMDRTEHHNGVLIYLAVLERKFAIIGDSGIDAVVPDGFWDDAKEQMQQLFASRRFCEGVCLGIRLTGEHLAKYFPHQAGDVNELSDEISEGK